MQALKLATTLGMGLTVCLAWAAQPAAAGKLVLQPIRVAQDVYAVVGDLNAQSYRNDGLNNNLGAHRGIAPHARAGCCAIAIRPGIVEGQGASDRTQSILAQSGSLQDAVGKIDQSKFKYLTNFDSLAKRNMNQVFTEMEQESF